VHFAQGKDKVDAKRFEAMVARLEVESGRSPTAYQLKVAALALLGFAILGLIVGVAGLGLLLLAGFALAMLLTGGGALIVLLKLGKLLLLLAIPLWYLVRHSISALFTRLPPPQGTAIARQQAPALFAAMDEMRRRMKGPRFHHVLIVDDMNAAVVQRPLFGLVGWPRNYLLLGLPLLESLSPLEALAVVAHEYGHLAGSHSHFAAFIYRLRHTWSTVDAVTAQWHGWVSRPMQRLVHWYAPYFNAYTFVLARTNEYQADAASAELVSAQVAATALTRVDLSAKRYERFLEQTFGSIRSSAQPPQDLSQRWAGLAPQAMAGDEARQWLQQALQRDSQVSDTHPALRERLRALSGQAPAADQLPPPLAGESAAAAWLGAAAAALRETLQRQWQERVNEPWARRHQEIQARLARLQELDAQPAPTLDEQIERLRLRVELQPDEDHLPRLAAFNAEHADLPLPLFLEARLRLKGGDAGALALLERVIVLDPEAIKPVSEIAFAFLKERKDEAAAAIWQERWNQRHQMEVARERQASALDVKHELCAVELDVETMERVKTLLRSASKGIKRAYLARRILPADPALQTFVLGIELTGWARFRSQGPAIVGRLAKLEWPIGLFVSSMAGAYKPLKRKLRAVPGSEIALTPGNTPATD
jgi:Zn-dependent protease with chaperone function